MFRLYRENIIYYVVPILLSERIMKKMNDHKIYFRKYGSPKYAKEISIIERKGIFIDIFYPISGTFRCYISEKEIKNIPDNYNKTIIENVLIVQITNQITLELVVTKEEH